MTNRDTLLSHIYEHVCVVGTAMIIVVLLSCLYVTSNGFSSWCVYIIYHVVCYSPSRPRGVLQQSARINCGNQAINQSQQQQHEHLAYPRERAYIDSSMVEVQLFLNIFRMVAALFAVLVLIVPTTSIYQTVICVVRR